MICPCQFIKIVYKGGQYYSLLFQYFLNIIFIFTYSKDSNVMPYLSYFGRISDKIYKMQSLMQFVSEIGL